MKSILAFVFLFSTFAFAKEKYHVDMQLNLEGKKLSTSKLELEEGKVKRLSQKGKQTRTFIEVVAQDVEETKETPAGILLSFIIGKVDGKGKRSVVARPQILALENQKAELMEAGEDGEPYLTMSVTVKKK